MVQFRPLHDKGNFWQHHAQPAHVHNVIQVNTQLRVHQHLVHSVQPTPIPIYMEQPVVLLVHPVPLRLWVRLHVPHHHAVQDII